MLIRTALLLALALLSLRAARGAPSPSFSCAKAQAQAERLICADAQLAEADSAMAKAYAAALPAAGRDKDLLTKLQRVWLKQMSPACGLATKSPLSAQGEHKASACLLDWLNDRTVALSAALAKGLSAAGGATPLRRFLLDDAFLAAPDAPVLTDDVLRRETSDLATIWQDMISAVLAPAKDASAGQMRVLNARLNHVMQSKLAATDVESQKAEAARGLRRAPDAISMAPAARLNHAAQNRLADAAIEAEKAKAAMAAGAWPVDLQTEWLKTALPLFGPHSYTLPCAGLERYPDLVDAIDDDGTIKLYSVNSGDCRKEGYPWPDASFEAFNNAVFAQDGHLFGFCSDSWTSRVMSKPQLVTMAWILPRRLLKQLGRPESLPLEAWSYDSVYNRRTFKHVAELAERAMADIKQIYVHRFGLSEQEAGDAARAALWVKLQWSGTYSPFPLSVAIMRADAQPDLATLLADDKPRPSTEEPLLSLAVDRAEAVRILLAAKEPVDATNSFGKTPLMTAAQFDDAESLALLLKAGAAVNLQTLLPQEIQGNDLETGRGAPCGKYAIKHGGRTALMYAAANANLAVILQLMAAGADKALRDSTGLLALDYLQGRGPVEANPVLSKTDRATAAQLLRVP